MVSAARSIWVDKIYFNKMGGIVFIYRYEAEGVNGQKQSVCGLDDLSFSLWRCQFCVKVLIMETLPSIILLGFPFWRKYSLSMNLGLCRGHTTFLGESFNGKVGTVEDKKMKIDPIRD